ncbi:hypothetical protein ACOME3_001190 [Neoechinorhynchus agilis]
MVSSSQSIVERYNLALKEAERFIGEQKFNEARPILEDISTSSLIKLQDEEHVRIKTQAIIELGNVMKRMKDADGLTQLIENTRPFLKSISKSKASRLVRCLVNAFLDMNAGTGREISLCKENIEWARKEKRTFLRQALEVRLIALYHDNKMYDESLSMGTGLLSEFKRLDDKHLLIDVHLLESKSYYALGNLAKSRASLTTARTAANAVYCPPKVQADLDMQSGVIHAADSDFKTAYSYFYEAFDGYDMASSLLDSQEDNARRALKYMILCKIMMNSCKEIKTIRSGKTALKYAGSDLDAIESVASTYQERSLARFEQTVKEHPQELQEDVVVRVQLNNLYDTLFEQNLTKLIEPYSRVEIAHIATLINRSESEVERRLSTMILDKKLNGILDQSSGVLVIYDSDEKEADIATDSLYKQTICVINQMNKVVDMLFVKAKGVAY